MNNTDITSLLTFTEYGFSGSVVSGNTLIQRSATSYVLSILYNPVSESAVLKVVQDIISRNSSDPWVRSVIQSSPFQRHVKHIQDKDLRFRFHAFLDTLTASPITTAPTPSAINPTPQAQNELKQLLKTLKKTISTIIALPSTPITTELFRRATEMLSLGSNLLGALDGEDDPNHPDISLSSKYSDLQREFKILQKEVSSAVTSSDLEAVAILSPEEQDPFKRTPLGGSRLTDGKKGTKNK